MMRRSTLPPAPGPEESQSLGGTFWSVFVAPLYADTGWVVGEILVEVVPKTAASGDLRRPVTVQPEDPNKRADEVLDATLEVAGKLKQRLDTQGAELTAAGASWGLNEVDLQFGLQLQAEAGVVVAKVGGTATFQVTLIWKKGNA
jgi:Trypsin-co-occurring domain 1